MKIKSSSSRPRICGTLMLWIAEDEMKKGRSELSDSLENKVTEPQQIHFIHKYA